MNRMLTAKEMTADTRRYAPTVKTLLTLANFVRKEKTLLTGMGNAANVSSTTPQKGMLTSKAILLMTLPMSEFYPSNSRIGVSVS